jgi:nucleoside-diphosphate-sugar epimerase
MDSTRIRAELGYGEPVALDVAIGRTIEWEQANRRPPYGRTTIGALQNAAA